MSEPCSVCDTPRIGSDQFCEVCGYDFVAQAGGVVPADGPRGTPMWEVVVTADRDHYETLTSDGIAFPASYAPRTFRLDAAEVRVGRRSASRGVVLGIDLAGDPEDTGISRVHAMLARSDDGTYTLLDLGSTNGTTLNDDDTPITPNTPVAVADGDRIHIGAWTTITVRRATEEVPGDGQ